MSPPPANSPPTPSIDLDYAPAPSIDLEYAPERNNIEIETGLDAIEAAPAMPAVPEASQSTKSYPPGYGTGSGQGFGSDHGRISSHESPQVDNNVFYPGFIGAQSNGAGPTIGLGNIGSEDPMIGEAAEPPEADSLSLVDRALAKLTLGNIAFNTPEKMLLGSVETVELLLSVKESAAQLTDAVAWRPVETAEGIRVAPEMEATLVGHGFRIEATTPARQAVSSLARVRWAWTISPIKAGSQGLDLSLNARIQVEGKDSPFVVRTFSKKILVEVSVTDQVFGLIKAHGAWLWTTVLLPLGVWFWKRRKAKSEPPTQGST